MKDSIKISGVHPSGIAISRDKIRFDLFHYSLPMKDASVTAYDMNWVG